MESRKKDNRKEVVLTDIDRRYLSGAKTHCVSFKVNPVRPSCKSISLKNSWKAAKAVFFSVEYVYEYAQQNPFISQQI